MRTRLRSCPGAGYRAVRPAVANGGAVPGKFYPGLLNPLSWFEPNQTIAPFTDQYVRLPGVADWGVRCVPPASAASYRADPRTGASVTGAVTPGVTFTFTTVGEWARIVLLDASGGVVGQYVPRGVTVGKTSYLDPYNVLWRHVANDAEGYGCLQNVELPAGGYPHVGLGYLVIAAGQSVGCTAPAGTASYRAIDSAGVASTGVAAPGAFTFTTTGSWRSVELLDGGGAGLARWEAALTPWPFRGRTDTFGVAWTVNGWTPTMVGHAQAGSAAAANANTPLDLWQGDTPYVHFPGAASNYVSMPSAAALNPTGVVTLIAYVALTDWTPAALSVVIGKRSTGNNSYYMRISTAGELTFGGSKDGTTNLAVLSAVLPVADYGEWIKTEHDPVTGTTTFAYSTSTPGTSYGNIVWTAHGSSSGIGAGALYSGTANLELGGYDGGTAPMMGGLSKARVIIGGTVVADFDAASCAQIGYTDTVGTAAGVWTINRATTGRKTTLVGPRSIAVLGTDDYYLLPLGAKPSMTASDAFSISIAMRQAAAPVSGGRYVSSESASNFGFLWYASGAGSFAAVTRVGDGVNIQSHIATASAANIMTVRTALVDNQGTPPRGITSYTNTVTTDAPLSLSAVGDRTTTLPLTIGASPAGGSVQDFEFANLLTTQSILSAADHGRLVAYYDGGS